MLLSLDPCIMCIYVLHTSYSVHYIVWFLDGIWKFWYLDLNCRDVVAIHVGCRVNSFSFSSSVTSVVLSTRGWRYLDFITTFRRYCDLILMSLLNTNTAPDPRGASQLQAQKHQGLLGCAGCCVDYCRTTRPSHCH